MISLWYHVVYVPDRSHFCMTLKINGQTYISLLSPDDFFSMLSRFPDDFEVGGLQIKFDNASHSFIDGMQYYFSMIWNHYMMNKK